MRSKVKRLILIAPLAIVGIALFIFVGGEIVLHLWNWLLPPLFGWRQLTFWQAIGLLVLCRILFGGVSGRGYAPLLLWPSHGRALGTHDARGARKIPPRHARTLRLRSAGEREQGVGTPAGRDWCAWASQKGISLSPRRRGRSLAATNMPKKTGLSVPAPGSS